MFVFFSFFVTIWGGFILGWKGMGREAWIGFKRVTRGVFRGFSLIWERKPYLWFRFLVILVFSIIFFYEDHPADYGRRDTHSYAYIHTFCTC